MHIPQAATIVVADGRNVSLYENTDTSGGLKLEALPEIHPHAESGGSGNRHHDSSANPSHGQAEEDDFAAGVAALLGRQVRSGTIQHLVVVAAPKTLGELRKHIDKPVSSALIGEIAKDLAGHTISDIEKAIMAA